MLWSLVNMVMNLQEGLCSMELVTWL